MFFSLQLNENSQIPVKKGLEQRLRQLLYILEGQKEEKIEKRKKETLRAFALDFLPKASFGEIAWFGLALGFDHFHVCGYTPINALNVLVSIMKSDVNSILFVTVVFTLAE